MRGRDWKRKYHFDELDIGEVLFLEGSYKSLYKAAYSWGVRYGIHLKCERTPAGAKLTRVEAPAHSRPPKQLTQTQRLQKLEDALRFISVLVIRIDKKLTELQEALK